MPKYRKKPVVIEAIRYTGFNAIDVADFTDYNFRPLPDGFDVTAQVYDKLHLTWVGVKDGQWIIRGVQGEYYPCDANVFRDTYDEVED